MRISKRVFILSLSILVCAVLYYPEFAFAAASISLSGGAWALGTKGALSWSQTANPTWTVTNNVGGTEDVLIKVTSSGTWIASTDGTQTVIDKFVLRKNTSGGTIITATNQTLVTGLGYGGTSAFGLYFKTPMSGSQEGAHTLTVTLTATNWTWNCGNTIAVDHTSPSSVTIVYETVTSSLTGASKCWITKNLGATQQATAATDYTDESAGWYWQFNRSQGYKVNPLSPPWTITSINEASDWTPGTDPCTLLFGTGWRLPTYTEWYNADVNGPWSNYNDTYASVLKLHAAGFLGSGTGGLNRNGIGNYWSSTQEDSTHGYYLAFSSTTSDMAFIANKAMGASVRCLKD